MENCEDAVIPFGKHQGKTLRDVLFDDPKYLDWLLTAEIRSPPLQRAVKEMNEKYAAEIQKAIDEHDHDL